MSSTTIQEIPAGTYGVDPVHSQFGFAVKHNGVSVFRGQFEEADARFEDGVLTGTAKVESVKTAIPDLKEHLLSADFFNVAETPEVSFRSTDVRIAGDDSVEVDGDLTIRGITKQVTAKGTLRLERRSLRSRGPRLRSRDDDRPARIRPQLAGRAPERRRRPRLGRHPPDPPGARKGVAMRILGLSGSLRDGSHNTTLLRAAARLLPPGVELEIFGGLRELPPYDADRDVEPANPAVARLRDAIDGADGVLIATPEYNGSIPGVLKNALDWASRPFPDNALKGKPVAVIGASTGLFGATWAQAETRKVLEVIGADVIEGELPVGGADSAFGQDGQLIEPEQRELLADLVNVLASRAGAAQPVAA